MPTDSAVSIGFKSIVFFSPIENGDLIDFTYRSYIIDSFKPTDSVLIYDSIGGFKPTDYIRSIGSNR